MYPFGVLADACHIAGCTAEGLAAVHSGLETARTTKEAELFRLEAELVRATAPERERSVALLEQLTVGEGSADDREAGLLLPGVPGEIRRGFRDSLTRKTPDT